MASFFLFFLLPLTTLLLLSFLRRRPSQPLPPGPKPLPIIGNMLMMYQLTHRGLAHLADRYGGPPPPPPAFLHAVAVSTPEIAKQVLQIQDNIFSNRPATIAITYLTYDRADMAFAHYGPFWRQMRKLCVTKLFSRKRAESWTSVRDEVDLAVKTLAARTGSPVNIGEVVFNLTMNITLRAAFGTQSNENEAKFISILQEFSRLFGAFNIGDFIPWLKWFDLNGINKRLRKARLELDWFIDQIIEEHRRNPKEADAEDTDMVDDMLAFFVDPTDDRNGQPKDLQGYLRLTKDNIKAIIMDVMFGGTETVASAIEWAMAEILRSPDELKRIQSELAQVIGLNRKVHESDLDKLPYLKCAIKETLRLHPPIPLLLHETAEDSTVAGYFIPKRSRVMINVWAIGRNKSAWKDPDAFRPSRFAPGGLDAAIDFRGNFFELLPFGSGRRSCPGMQLGLYALELAVANLLHCFSWDLPDGMKPSELSMDDVFGLTAPRAERLVAVPKPRLLCGLDA
ncbi:LOW QUALITY PROTEIN: cytochrome P450 84A1-like [Phalaenopsis equestris]|uniref:LOW QUALITY PROTEIN: cytochrome P450 84A1-like n=1 Tax=Phalaenopsis equestris TaxID=78828 RepID=UPI0009E1EC19|nr:LOW QUALITY PROTEIN: cytochrome P450 84A1-like [Phalaenopsis equestris]